MQVKVTRVAANTSTGDQDIRISGLTETPNAVVITWTLAIADNTVANDLGFGIGAATATTERWSLCVWADDAAATTASRRDIQNDQLITIRNAAGGLDAEADFVSFLSDAGSGAGVRINWSNAPAAAYLLTVTLFAANDALAGTYAAGGSNGATTTVTPGFPSDLILGAYNGMQVNNLDVSDARISIGACDGSLSQGNVAYFDNEPVGTSAVGGA